MKGFRFFSLFFVLFCLFLLGGWAVYHSGKTILYQNRISSDTQINTQDFQIVDVDAPDTPSPQKNIVFARNGDFPVRFIFLEIVSILYVYTFYVRGRKISPHSLWQQAITSR